MCLNTLYRFPVPSDRLLFGEAKGYKNGAFVFSKDNVPRLSSLCATFPDLVDGLQEIPCGQCLECRISYSKMWAQRCICEAQMSDNDCYFITLTYDDEHLPAPIKTLPLSVPAGVVVEEPVLACPLKKEDMTLFLKRLRVNLDRKFGVKGVRFLYCGEYGEEFGRPHYHMLLFNVKLQDIELAFNRSLMSGKDIPYFKSKLVSDTWGKGFVTISPLTWENAAYTCRYVMKKRKGSSKQEYEELCHKHKLEPLPYEFINMSRDPGIGRAYYEENKGFIYNFDQVQLPNGLSLKPCRYYDDLYDLQFPEAFEAIKIERESKIARQKLNRALDGSISASESVKKRERWYKRIVKKLKRTL